MAEIINQIPGYENGRVQRISASKFSASLIVAQMAIDLQEKWNTKVLCISLDERKDFIESLLINNSSFRQAIILNQKNPDINVVIKKISGHVHRKFVRAVIISGAERLTTRTEKDRPENGQEWIDHLLDGLAKGMRLPIILVQNVVDTPII